MASSNVPGRIRTGRGTPQRLAAFHQASEPIPRFNLHADERPEKGQLLRRMASRTVTPRSPSRAEEGSGMESVTIPVEAS